MNIFIESQTLYLTVRQVAERYNVSTDTIWRWKRKGDFPKAVHLGTKTTRWRMSDLIAHEASMRCGLIIAA